MMKFNSKIWFPIGLAIYSQAPLAAEYRVGALFSPTLAYDDNVRMRSDNERGSFYTRITPTLQLGRYDDNSSLAFNAGYRIERYTSLSQLDREDPFANFSGSYKTARSTYGLTASYAQNAQRDIAEEDAGDFSSDTTVTSRSIAPSYQYQLSERDFVFTNLSYSERTYSSSDSDFGFNRFSDNETLSGSVGWNRIFTERYTGGVVLSYMTYESESDFMDSEYDSYHLNLTSKYTLSEKWSFNGSVGYRTTDSDTTYATGLRRSDTSTGTLFSAALAYSGEVDTLSFSVSRSLQPSGEGVVNETDQLSISWSRRLNEQLSLALTGSYQESNSADDLRNTDREYYTFSPSLRWRVQEQLSLNFGYQFRKQKGNISGASNNSDTVDSNMVFLTINYNWDGIRFSR